jgi:xanthine/uracil permease
LQLKWYLLVSSTFATFKCNLYRYTAVTTLLACTVALFVFAVKRFRAGGVTELSVATAVAVLVSFAMGRVVWHALHDAHWSALHV